MKYIFTLNDSIDLGRLKDSMQLDSGTVVAELRSGGHVVTLEVKGDVRVLFNPDPKGLAKDGSVYKTPSDFPEELMKIFQEEQCTADMPNVFVDDNNWFEIFVWQKTRQNRSQLEWTGFSDCVFPEDFEAETIFGYLMDALKYYLTKDVGLVSRVGSVRMTKKEFLAKWGNVNPDDLDEDDLLNYKEDCFAMYETGGFLKTIRPIYTDSPSDGCSNRQFKVIRRANLSEADIEALPLWKIQFKNGQIAYCYPEEICKLEAKNIKPAKK